MTPKIRHIKLFIKITIITFVLSVFIVLGIFIRPNRTFENLNMKRWASLNEQQRIETVRHIIKDAENQDLLVQCTDKIANLPNSNEMMIRDAVVFCYAGIQQQAQENE